MSDDTEKAEDTSIGREFDFSNWRQEGESALRAFDLRERELLEDLDKVRKQKAELEEALGKKRIEVPKKAKSKKRIKPLLIEYLMVEGRDEEGGVKPVSVDELIEFVQSKQPGVPPSSIELSITRLVRNNLHVKWVQVGGSKEKGLAYLEESDDSSESE